MKMKKNIILFILLIISTIAALTIGSKIAQSYNRMPTFVEINKDKGKDEGHISEDNSPKDEENMTDKENPPAANGDSEDKEQPGPKDSQGNEEEQKDPEDAQPEDEGDPDDPDTGNAQEEDNPEDDPEQGHNPEEIGSPNDAEGQFITRSGKVIEIDKNGIYAGKKVYLTFDDGPSIYTEDILDYLDEYGVKATFFVLGFEDDISRERYNKIVERGHALAMHSYSHRYKEIYNSVQDFDKDFTKISNLLYDITGHEPKIYRFPGGSGNTVSKKDMKIFIKYLNKKSVLYYDWNVDSGDALNYNYTKEELRDNVLNGVATKRRAIVLMHDSERKRNTVDALPEILEALISQGAEILPIDESVEPIQQVKSKL